MQVPICPTCGKPAPSVRTAYGLRSECCGLRSWNGQPLVSPATLEARATAYSWLCQITTNRLLSHASTLSMLRKRFSLIGTEASIGAMDEHMASQAAAYLKEQYHRLKASDQSFYKRRRKA